MPEPVTLVAVGTGMVGLTVQLARRYFDKAKEVFDMFGKNGNGQKDEAQLGVSPEEGGLEVTISNGPGVHGFSGLQGIDIRGEAAAFDPEKPAYEVGGLMSGGDAVTEMRAAPEVARPEVGRELPRVYGDAAPVRGAPPETGGEIMIITHRDPGEAPRLSRFDSELEAQAFVEDLIRQGLEQAAIETLRAYKLDFEVSFKPIVDFKD